MQEPDCPAAAAFDLAYVQVHLGRPALIIEMWNRIAEVYIQVNLGRLARLSGVVVSRLFFVVRGGASPSAVRVRTRVKGVCARARLCARARARASA